jgi:predicted small integral membrane protein
VSALFIVPLTIFPAAMLCVAAVVGLQVSAPLGNSVIRPGDIVDVFTIVALALELLKACRIDAKSAYNSAFAVLIGIGIGLLLFFVPAFVTVYAGKLAIASIASIVLAPILRIVVARRDIHLSR